MNKQNEIMEKMEKLGKSTGKFIERYLKTKVMIVIGILMLTAIISIGLSSRPTQDNKTTKMGVEDIGEVVTQVAYCTEISLTEDVKKLLGLKIPFTQRKYICSYDFVIKAGVDFGEIEWKEKNNTIEVKLPEVKVISSELDMESFKIYHKDESVFNQIDLADNNEAIKIMKRNAEKTAVENGLLEEARSNAEMLVKEFISSAYDLKKYKVVFTDKQ